MTVIINNISLKIIANVHKDYSRFFVSFIVTNKVELKSEIRRLKALTAKTFVI